MFRASIAASILALSVTAAQAGSAADPGVADPRIQQAAKDVCGQLLQSSHYTSLFYQNWFKDCMRSSSVEITRQVEAKVGRYPAFAQK